jgi:hypothetical protein
MKISLSEKKTNASELNDTESQLKRDISSATKLSCSTENFIQKFPISQSDSAACASYMVSAILATKIKSFGDKETVK